MSAGSRRIAWGLWAVVAVGTWPHLFAFGLWPTSRDAALWIVRGAVGRPGWIEWVFATKHFVGYRPVAALSYTLDSLVGGFAAWSYRGTDLALHAGCALLVYALHRRLAPDAARWGGIVAAAIFVAHPAVSEVVPHLARRSYTLATLFGLAAACVATTPARAARVRSLAAGVFVAAAVLSNEVAFATVPMIVVLAWITARRRGESLAAACAGPLVAVLVALALRAGVAGGVGGYATGFARGERVVPIVAATWSTLVALPPSGVGLVLASGITSYYLIRALAGAADTTATGRVPALLVAWLGCHALLFAPLGVWFPRQTYPLLAPFALLVALLLADTVNAAPGPVARWARAAHLAVQALALGAIFAHSPVLRGPNAGRVEAWRKTDALLRGIHADLAALSPPATVRLAVPYYGRDEVEALRAREPGDRPPAAADLPVVWLNGVLDGSGVGVGPLLAFEKDPAEPPGGCRLLAIDGRPAADLDAGRRFWILARDAAAERTPRSVRVTLDPRSSAEHTRLYVHDGGGGTLSPEFP